MLTEIVSSAEIKMQMDGSSHLPQPFRLICWNDSVRANQITRSKKKKKKKSTL